MLVSTLQFEIRNSTTGEIDNYIIENTIENQEKVLTHRYTRQIKFVDMFTFQFEKEMKMPVEFIEMDTWIRMVELNPELAAAVADMETVN